MQLYRLLKWVGKSLKSLFAGSIRKQHIKATEISFYELKIMIFPGVTFNAESKSAISFSHVHLVLVLY